jgi:hypothetical protein
MPNAINMQLNFRKVPNDPNMFEFTITTPLLRCQFRVPRVIINQLRVDLEKALLTK